MPSSAIATTTFAMLSAVLYVLLSWSFGILNDYLFPTPGDQNFLELLEADDE